MTTIPTFLIKSTEEYWLSDKESVNKFHKQLQQDSVDQDYQITGFAYTEKPIKEGKEVVDSYFIVKVIKVFDNAKEPEGIPMESVTYNRKDSSLCD